MKQIPTQQNARIDHQESRHNEMTKLNAPVIQTEQCVQILSEHRNYNCSARALSVSGTGRVFVNANANGNANRWYDYDWLTGGSLSIWSKRPNHIYYIYRLHIMQ